MEEKKYEIIGKVEIGTDEYRDLIEENIRNKNENSRLYSERYDLNTKLERSNKIAESQKEQIEKFKKFLKDEKLEDRYKLYLIEQQQKEDELEGEYE